MVKVVPFGKSSKGIDVNLYEIINSSGAKAVLTNYGAIIVKIIVPNKSGIMKDVVLGYDTIEDYENNNGNFGAVVGRYANRIRNGEFILNGETYHLAKNNFDVNTLHGGTEGYAKKVWTAEYDDNSVTFSYFSHDMEENFPGNLNVSIRYDFTDENELKLTYKAISDRDTIVNLTNHVYFNLDGHDGANAEDMILEMNTPWYTPVNTYLQPTGEILSVENTPFDFTSAKRIGEDINAEDSQLKNGKGYDHNFIFLKEERHKYEKCAQLYSAHSGICMDVYTTQPAVQFYTGNNITEREGKDGVKYYNRQGICLETQHFPDSMYNTHFPTPILCKDEKYEEITTFKFFIK